MWSWCGEVSYATEANIATYLSLMSGLELDYPKVSFVYMTGHTDGPGLDREPPPAQPTDPRLLRSHPQGLYDFEDIESYDPDGAYFGDKHVTDTCDYTVATGP